MQLREYDICAKTNPRRAGWKVTEGLGGLSLHSLANWEGNVGPRDIRAEEILLWELSGRNHSSSEKHTGST